MSILILQSSWWRRESWLLCLICLPDVSWWLSGFLAVPWGCLRFVIVVFPDHTRLLFFIQINTQGSQRTCRRMSVLTRRGWIWLFVCLLVCLFARLFVCSMFCFQVNNYVMARRSNHLITLFSGQAWVNSHTSLEHLDISLNITWDFLYSFTLSQIMQCYH